MERYILGSSRRSEIKGIIGWRTLFKTQADRNDGAQRFCLSFLLVLPELKVCVEYTTHNTDFVDVH